MIICLVYSSPVLVIHLRLFDSLIFGSAILEPDLDLGLRQIKRLCQLEPSGSGDVLVPLVLQFEPQRLVRCERRALTSLTRVLASASCH